MPLMNAVDRKSVQWASAMLQQRIERKRLNRGQSQAVVSALHLALRSFAIIGGFFFASGAIR